MTFVMNKTMIEFVNRCVLFSIRAKTFTHCTSDWLSNLASPQLTKEVSTQQNTHRPLNTGGKDVWCLFQNKTRPLLTSDWLRSGVSEDMASLLTLLCYDLLLTAVVVAAFLPFLLGSFWLVHLTNGPNVQMDQSVQRLAQNGKLSWAIHFFLKGCMRKTEAVSNQAQSWTWISPAPFVTTAKSVPEHLQQHWANYDITRVV